MVNALIDAVPDRYRALVLLAAGTGLRQGECFGVSDEHLNLDTGSLRVQQQIILLARMEPFLAPPKTSASHLTIPLPQVVVDAVRDHLSRYPVIHRDGLIFTDENGDALRRTRFSREIWRPAVEAAGARRGTGFHDLRHYYASLLIRHGESIKTVQRRLGHATAAETLDTYAHLWPDSEDRTRSAIDSVLRSSRQTRSVTNNLPARGLPGPTL